MAALLFVPGLGWALPWSAPIQSAAAQSAVRAPHVTVSLIPEYSTLSTTGRMGLAVKFELEPGWHIYFAHPGQSGIGTRVRWQLPKGVTVDSLRWPVPERLVTEGLVTHIYPADVILVTTVHARLAGGSATILASVNWGACQTQCVAGKAELRLVLPSGTGAPNPAWREVAAAVPRLPGPISGLAISARRRGTDLELVLKPATALPRGVGPWTFFPFDADVLDSCAVGSPRIAGGAAVLRLGVAAPGATRLRGILTGWPDGGGPAGLVVDVGIGD